MGSGAAPRLAAVGMGGPGVWVGTVKPSSGSAVLVPVFNYPPLAWLRALSALFVVTLLHAKTKKKKREKRKGWPFFIAPEEPPELRLLLGRGKKKKEKKAVVWPGVGAGGA